RHPAILLLTRAAVVLLGLPLIGAAPAQPAAPAVATPPALNFLLQQGYHVIRSFQAVSGLTGWVIQSAGGENNVFYSTADGQSLIAGDLLTGEGDNLTDRYLDQYAPPDLSAIWARFDKAGTIVAGTHSDPKSVIYVIMDPNCIFCHLLWIALKPYEAAGLQVRWVPVGFLHHDSAAK